MIDAAAVLRHAPLVCGVALAAAIFSVESLGRTTLDFPALYVLPVLVASLSGRRLPIALAAVITAGLMLMAFGLRAAAGEPGWGAILASVGLLSLGIATVIMMRGLRVATLAASEARLLDETHDSVTVRSLDGTVTYWNRASGQLYGWSSEDALGKPMRDLLGTRSEPSMDVVEAIVGKVGKWEGEVVNLTRDGAEIVVETRLALLRDDRGHPAAILETGKDVTGRRRSDEEHRLNEARYHGMFQTMGVAYWEMDFSRVKARCDDLWRSGVRDFPTYVRDNPGFIRECINLSVPRDVNAASVRLFGARDAAHLMSSFSACWPPEGEQVFGGAMLAALRNTPVFETEAVLRGVDGRRVEALFTVSYPKGSEARDSIVVALLDLSESNRAKAELRAAQDDLAHAMRLTSLGILTATIAHEVNQPLGGVIANARAGLRWLRRETPDVAEVGNSIEQALSEAKRAAGVLSRIRAMARKAEPEPMALDLNELVDETMALLAGELRNGGIELRIRLAQPGPIVVADRIQVQQVIINLALNSVHAMNDIDDRPRVLTVSTRSDGALATVSVDDTGQGIKPELADQLFTPFFTTKGQGLGVGLSVCGNIIERHGGRISVTKKDAPGFCVQFTLPLTSE